MISPRILLAFAVASILILSLGFGRNQWRAADPEWYESFHRNGESVVVGRMIKAQQDGLFSGGGLNGRYYSPGDKERPIPENAAAQFAFYFGGDPAGEFSPYRSQNGWQGIGYAVLDRLVPASPAATYAFMRGLTGLVTALVVTVLLCWFLVEFGLTAAITALLGTAAAQWITVYGPHIFYVTWSLFLPLLAALFLLRRRVTLRAFVGWLFVAFLAKVVLSGYEFITCVTIMALVPLVFHASREAWPRRKWIHWTGAVGVAVAAALVVSVTILLLQVGAAAGDMSVATTHLTEKLESRTLGNADGLDAGASEAANAPLWTMFNTYINNQVFDFGYAGDVPLHVPFYTLTLIFLAVNGAYAIAMRRRGGVTPPATRALIIATWFSLLAPFSWLLLFKAHSWVHVHLNQIVWHLPFLFFAFALAGHLLARLRRA